MPQKKVGNNKNCLNCGTAIHENYCENCGQPTNTGQITFKETINTFLSIAFAFEGKLWLTIRLLITNPGKLFREYISGKRNTYYKPVAFFILVTAVYLILRAVIGFDPMAVESVKNDMEKINAFSPKAGEVFKLMSLYINNILFLLVLSTAFMLKLFFRKRYNLAEYTSIALFIVGIYTMIKTITMFIDKFAKVEIDNIELGILILLIFYSSFSLFQKKNFGSLVKYAMVGFFSFSLYIVFALLSFLLLVSLMQF